MTRRQWLGAAGAVLMGPKSGSAAALTLQPSSGGLEEEAYWSRVRQQFELTPERTNLVTVVRGVTTRATRERIAAETQRINSFLPAQNPTWRQEVSAQTARFIGAPEASVALLRNTTEGVGTVLLNWPLQRGDEILTSSAEHGPFYGILERRAQREGVVVRKFHYPAPAVSLDAIVEAIDSAVTPRTKLVIVGQVVLTGQINPIRAIADLVHQRGAVLLVDGVLAVGHIPVDVTAMDCDFFAAGFHKWGCGPRGTAVFYVRRELAERLPPLLGPDGASMAKYEVAGAHPDAHYAALADSLHLLSGIGAERIRARLYSLTARWLRRAQQVPGFRSAVALDPSQCAGLAAWEIEGIDRARLRQVLVERRVSVGGTEDYGGFFGIPAEAPRSLMIANAGVFTSTSDVDQLADAIEAAGRVR